MVNNGYYAIPKDGFGCELRLRLHYKYVFSIYLRHLVKIYMLSRSRE